MTSNMDDEAGRNQVATLTRNDRLSIFLVFFLAAVAVAAGVFIRQQTSNQTWFYESRTSGISANYPAGWLVDERGDYVARIRDPRSRPFKTQFTIAVAPASGQATIRNVLDSLNIQRSADLAAYRVLRIEKVSSSRSAYTQMSFAYVDADPNPFIQRLPVVVLGLDFVIQDGNRAIIVTYMADQNTFDSERPTFNRFFASIRY